MRHVKALIKLKQQGAIIEKSLEYFFNNMKIDPDIVQGVLEECEFLTDERNKIENLLRSKTSEIGSSFETVRSIINQCKNGQNIDTDDCQRKMKDLLEKIDQFDVKSEMEILEKQQKELDDVVNEFKVNMSKYENEKNLTGDIIKKYKSITKRAGIDNENNDDDDINYDEINNFHSLIIKTGHTQHWSEKDHIHFLNARKKCSNISGLVNEIQKRCPDLSAKKIINHETWYKFYLNLREKQRKSINEWRQRKELEKIKKIESIKNTEVYKNEIDSKQKINDEIFNMASNKSSKITSSSEKSNGVIEDKKQLIKQWKIQKENAKIADEQRLKHQSEAMRAWKDKQFLMRAIAMRDAVAKYNQEKNEKKLKLLLTNNAVNNKIIKSSVLVKSLRKKDEDFLKKRKNLIETKYQKLKMNHYNVTITNNNRRSFDESTLMKPTEVWKEKCKPQNLSEPNSRPNFYIKDLPKM
ncbi:hypothetical protein PV325_000674 [Microctonus aethiopoides]|nr:hypothetical protein PV325_000674 [Microctonus aethiopoides]